MSRKDPSVRHAHRSKEKPPGRPRIPFDLKQFEALCHIQCTEVEIAAVMNIDVGTLETRVLEHYGKLFSEVFAAKKALGKMSLRRRQYRRIEEGSDTMLIFLGKQYLGQADKQEIVGRLNHNVYEGKTDAELQSEIDRLKGIIDSV